MGRRWTEEDVNKLTILAQRHPAPRIAEIMDRTVGGVVFKAHKLKLSLRTRGDIKRLSVGDHEASSH
jgi:hypothetical protein